MLRRLFLRFVLFTAVAGSELPSPTARAGAPTARVDPNYAPLGVAPPTTVPSFPTAPPAYRPSAPSSPRRPVVNCDAYGRCWQQVPGYRDPGGYGARPPGWADDVPYRARDPYRFDRPRSGVVCDRGTSLCYKRGRLDRSETRDTFGDRAGERAGNLRDRRGTGQVFVPERGVSCDTRRKLCFDGGVADYSQTRRYFGARAADAVE
jgi:Fels-1 Prophage Protein-like